MKIAVTGATGALGGLVIQHLIKNGTAPADIIAVVRNLSRAADLKQKGVQLREANYDDLSGLEAALAGAQRVLLVSGSEVGQRARQHGNAIAAARKNDVEQLIYTSLTRADTSSNILAPEHKATEEILQDSGLEYAILRNNWYTENYAADIQYAAQSGQIATATGKGRVASAARTDLAEAAARVLAGSGHGQKIYELCGPVWDYAELARAASTVLNREVVYQPISAAERKANLLAAGMDEGTAGFYAMLDESIAAGTLDIESPDLEQLLGRKPLSLIEGLGLLVA